MTDQLLCTKDVATLLGVSVKTVTRWVDAGELKTVFKGPGIRGAYMFDPKDVEAFKAKLPELGYYRRKNGNNHRDNTNA